MSMHVYAPKRSDQSCTFPTALIDSVYMFWISSVKKMWHVEPSKHHVVRHECFIGTLYSSPLFLYKFHEFCGEFYAYVELIFSRNLAW